MTREIKEKRCATGNADFNKVGEINPIRENAGFCPTEIRICDGKNTLSKIEKTIYLGESITFDEAVSLGQMPADRLPELLETSQRVNHFLTAVRWISARLSTPGQENAPKTASFAPSLYTGRQV